MGFRLSIYNWPPVHTSYGEKKMGSRPDIHSAPCLHFLKQETNGLQDYIFMTGLLSMFQDLHLNIKTSNRNMVNNQTLDIFMAGTEWD